ncbi:exosome complex component RRP43-like isoform X2 [Cylas formicarius]|uniref:exosome complex component RRP43-like isoform X2 n=1 Tax=Cylas formicarius TaxID=197179 RepID=UPI00295858CD|nr:exosome complex component RRP43-like isoform X2 [Cylas formicarius]
MGRAINLVSIFCLTSILCLLFCFRSLHPLKYCKDYLAHNVRPDGREFCHFRPIIVNTNSIVTSDGSSIAKVGKTIIMCGAKAELCKPKPDSPKQGFLVPNLELPPLCSPKFKPGPPSEEAQVLTQLIADIIDNSKCIDLEELCIYPDKLAWCLYVDLICLNHDGSLVDACIIALMSCLNTVTLPLVEYDPAVDNQQVNLEVTKSLPIHSLPVSTTFAVFDDIFLADPTLEEENLCSSKVTVVIKDGELCCVYKPGGSAISNIELLDCIDKSKRRVPTIKELLQTSLITA